MQTTSEAWKQAIRSEYRAESKAVIDGEELPVVTLDSAEPTPVKFCTVRRQLMSEKRPIGNANSSVLQMTYIPTRQPARRAEICLFTRLVGADGTRTDWLPKGVFYISNRKKGHYGDLSLVAYDALRQTERPYWTEGDTGEWPRSAPDVVADIAQHMGVAIDPRTKLNAEYKVEFPNDLTDREILEHIAAAHGGNWCMTDVGELLLVCLGELPDETNYLVNNHGDAILFGGVRILV